mmetsp:Transcript_88934/g.229435  ORF Transcript_88934/g.229435 Transcript_88934/m.229435 type:complete len:433 (-) Transcript_88934:112-1410(-)
MEIEGSNPEEALRGGLGVLLGVDQAVRHRNVLQATIVHARRAREHLDVRLALEDRSAVDAVGVIEVETHSVEFAVGPVRAGDEQRVPLQLVEVDKESLHGHVARVEAPSHASGQVCHRLLYVATSSHRLPASSILFAPVWHYATSGEHLGVRLLDERRPQHVREELRPAADWRAPVRAIVAGRRYRHIVVDLDAHPGTVFVQAHDVDALCYVPAVEELAHELGPQRDSLQSLNKVAVIEATLAHAAHVRPVRGRLVEDVARVGVVRHVGQPHPRTVAEQVGHMAGHARLPQPGLLRVPLAAHVELAVMGREGHKPVGGVCPRQTQLCSWELLWVVGPTAIRADPLRVTCVDGPADHVKVDACEGLLLVAVALRVEPALVMELNAVVVASVLDTLHRHTVRAVLLGVGVVRVETGIQSGCHPSLTRQSLHRAL